MPALARLLLALPRCTQLERLRKKVQGRTVLITGASYGIGEAAALLLAQAGAEVLLVARTAEKLREISDRVERAGGRAQAYPTDLYSTDQVAALAKTLLDNHPRIDIVISNAGKSIRRRVIRSLERDDLGRLVRLNLISSSLLLTALLPRMLEQGGGHIVNVSSVSARLPIAPNWAAYQASKAGFDAWLRSVANEVRPNNIRVSSVYLPLVRTRMVEPSRFYQNMPALSPLEAAQVIAYALVTGVERVAPWWLWWGELASLLAPRLVNHLLCSWENRHG